MLYLFVKAKDPNLVAEKRTDRSGHQVTRWVKRDQPIAPHPAFSPPPAPEGESRDAMMSRLKGAITTHVAAHHAHLKEVEGQGYHVPWGHVAYTAGLPGSGKTTYLKAHHFQHGVFAHVDVDAFKPHIAGYDPKAPHHVHGESKELAAHLHSELERHKMPIIMDTTGGNWQKINKQLSSFQRSGYHSVGIHSVRVRPEVSRQRNAARERSVPDSVIAETAAEHTPDYVHPQGEWSNQGRTPLQHIMGHIKQIGLKHTRHVHDSENDAERVQRSAQGWRDWRESVKAMAKAVSFSLLEIALKSAKIKLR